MNARVERIPGGNGGMMIAGLNASELAELALLLVAVGALSGFLAGLFGIGGGAILVPVFYECFRLAGVPLEVRMPLCIGTSLAIIIPTSIRSWRAHHSRGAVDMEIVRTWWLPVLAGVIAVGFMLRAKHGAQAVETTALYWHFVDAAWMPIFSFIYLWPAR